MSASRLAWTHLDNELAPNRSDWFVERDFCRMPLKLDTTQHELLSGAVSPLSHTELADGHVC